MHLIFHYLKWVIWLNFKRLVCKLHPFKKKSFCQDFCAKYICPFLKSIFKVNLQKNVSLCIEKDLYIEAEFFLKFHMNFNPTFQVRFYEIFFGKTFSFKLEKYKNGCCLIFFIRNGAKSH